jgi:FAD/FMN-containing dehydrogenase
VLMDVEAYQSWGRYPIHQPAAVLNDIDALRAQWQDFENGVLPFGNGRSYGDVCQNNGGAIFDSRRLDHFISFDEESGTLRCQAGVMLSEIIRVLMPMGWFPAVVPGTKFVSVGGAIANDIHGKNHGRVGSFGRHVDRMCLLRSDGTSIECSRTEQPTMFSATLGGMGLTGLIVWADIRLRRVPSSFLDVETVRFNNLAEYFELARQADRYEYFVSWVDCQAAGARLGRGIAQFANHRADPSVAPRKKLAITMPAMPPTSLVNRATISVFNSCYFALGPRRRVASVKDFDRFFFPLDSISNWNRIYGPRGFRQHQCVIPHIAAPDAIREILTVTAAHRSGSFLVVLKEFGAKTSGGLLSFPLHGSTLAIDFANTSRNAALLKELDEIVADHGGRIYLAKDAGGHLSSSQYAEGALDCFKNVKDPRVMSDAWRRIMSSFGN